MFATTLSVVATKSSLERATRIELAFSAWEADVLPLNYARVIVHRIVAMDDARGRKYAAGGSTRSRKGLAPYRFPS